MLYSAQPMIDAILTTHFGETHAATVRRALVGQGETMAAGRRETYPRRTAARLRRAFARTSPA